MWRRVGPKGRLVRWWQGRAGSKAARGTRPQGQVGHTAWDAWATEVHCSTARQGTAALHDRALQHCRASSTGMAWRRREWRKERASGNAGSGNAASCADQCTGLGHIRSREGATQRWSRGSLPGVCAPSFHAFLNWMLEVHNPQNFSRACRLQLPAPAARRAQGLQNAPMEAATHTRVVQAPQRAQALACRVQEGRERGEAGAAVECRAPSLCQGGV